MEKQHIVLIGDCHNDFASWRRETYLAAKISKNMKTIQLGDFGYLSKGFNAWKALEHCNVDFNQHKILGGNHDDYNIYPNSPYALGDFGVTEDGIFFVRGAYSINKANLIPGVSYFPEEELNTAQQNAAFNSYLTNKPKIVISHDCPESILPFLRPDPIQDKTSTRNMLQHMLDAHIPKMWVFGHHHVNRSFCYNGCEFVCLNELETKIISV